MTTSLTATAGSAPNSNSGQQTAAVIRMCGRSGARCGRTAGGAITAAGSGRSIPCHRRGNGGVPPLAGHPAAPTLLGRLRLVAESGLLLSRSASDEICRKISQNSLRQASRRPSWRGRCQWRRRVLGPVYLRVSAACLPNFFKSRSKVSRSFFERTLATSSIAAACSPNPRLISARPLGVSSTLRTRRSSG